MNLRPVLALLWALDASPVAAQGDFPIPLRIDAMDRGCAPVTDTVAYPGLETPLFRFGVYEVGRDTLLKASAAYWCIMPNADRGTALVIWRERGDAPLPGGCASVIRYWSSPGGLRFERRSVVRLSSAHPVDQPSRVGPPVSARGTVIVSEYDGKSARFICHTGRWYVAVSP